LASALEKPSEIFTIEAHANVHGITYQTARTDLLGLRDMGLLDMRKEGKKFVFTPPQDLSKRLKAETGE
jgi:Fic family protein